jgi:hypothetical protein
MKHLFVAGFDFGTSCSKVVLRDQLTGIAKAVTFGAAKLGLLPSLLRVHANNLYGPLDDVAGEIISYPKLIAADVAEGGDRFRTVYSDRFRNFQKSAGMTNSKDAADVLLIRYFYTVIRGIRDFISRDRDWSDSDAMVDPLMVQLAVPSGLMAQRDGSLEEMMRNALKAAHYLAHQQSEVPVLDDLLRVKSELKQLGHPALEVLDKCCVIYPEVAAGVQAILRSHGTPEGKYITMDVGAGTVDLNAFYRHEKGLDYWSCEVVPLGVARLKYEKAATSGNNHDTTFDPLSEPLLMTRLRAAVDKLMTQAFRYQPKTITGNGRSPWHHETFAYIWGGGSAYLPYEQNYLKALGESGVVVTDFANRLPVPIDNFTLPKDVGDFGRLAVAYGLSYHYAKLDAVRLPSELKTFTERYPAYWQISKRTSGACSCYANLDCSKCCGTGFIKPEQDLVPNWNAIKNAWCSKDSGGQHTYRGQYYQALEACVNGLQSHGARIAEKVDFLNQIQVLIKRPELPSNLGLVEDGNSALLYNVRRLGGMVSVIPGSAVLNPDESGIRVVISLRPNQHMEVELFCLCAVDVAQLVNKSPGPPYFMFGCAVTKDQNNGFHLIINKMPNGFQSWHGIPRESNHVSENAHYTTCERWKRCDSRFIKGASRGCQT